MKKLIFLGILMLLGAVAFAQQPAKHSKKESAKTTYVCAKCFATADAPGDCKMDGSSLVKMGDYFCPKCLQDTGTKKGKCTMDVTTPGTHDTEVCEGA